MLSVIELFAGAGGLALGARNAGFTLTALVEHDEIAAATLSINSKILEINEGEKIYNTDVRSFDFSKFEGKIDLLCGGPPCQPFSIGGLHGSHMDPRDLFSQITRAIYLCKPKFFIIENVKGLARTSFKSYLDYITLQLSYPEINSSEKDTWSNHFKKLIKYSKSKNQRGLTYSVLSSVVDSANYGVPQRRERLFIMGARADLKTSLHFPPPTHSQEALLWHKWRSPGDSYWDRHCLLEKMEKTKAKASELLSANNILEKPSASPWVTVRDAFRNLPPPHPAGIKATLFTHHEFVAGARVYRGHKGSSLDQPSKTIKAGVHGVPGGENMLCLQENQVRYFTIRECARLQTFPDSYEFNGTRSKIIRQLGNAVPPTLAKAICKPAYDALSEVGDPVNAPYQTDHSRTALVGSRSADKGRSTRTKPFSPGSTTSAQLG